MTMSRVVLVSLIFGLGLISSPGALARDWQSLPGTGWQYDVKDVKTELKDGVVNTENTMVFQLRQDAADGKPAPKTAEPTAQLYVLCQSRQYRMWDVATSSQIGPMSTAMFEVAQTLEVYCDRIGKLPEDRKGPPGRPQ